MHTVWHIVIWNKQHAQLWLFGTMEVDLKPKVLRNILASQSIMPMTDQVIGLVLSTFCIPAQERQGQRNIPKQLARLEIEIYCSFWKM